MPAEPSAERTYGGLGAGLTLVRGLVEMHGGTVEACSQGADQGSEFCIRLPWLPGRTRRGIRHASDGRNEFGASIAC